jgi:hypothetical protein
VATPAETPHFVSFKVEPEDKQKDGHWRYRATYPKNGRTARFTVEFTINGSTEGKIAQDKGQFNQNGYVQSQAGKGWVVKTGRGSIIADPRSDASVLLADLKTALDATESPARSIRVKELPFEFVVLGENMTHSSDPGRRTGGLVEWELGGYKVILWPWITEESGLLLF